ncbi:MAG TPA: isoprenylcysteine carboxylmethyltransferase family protein [Kofleriaceae bacterium]|nr:isoprenylcysteine carboxylmethyltransferase family protein [Kofleriaceae bacterium]
MNRKAVAGFVFLFAVLAAALFGPAGSLDYWQAWAFLAVFATAGALVTVDLARRDPALLARRVQAGPAAEPTPRQKWIQGLATLAYLAVFVVAGFDHREGWSRVPAAAVIAGDALVVIGLYVVFRVFRANTFASAVVEVRREQPLISTGPYAVVRHPMYTGALVMMVGVPIALGSWWGLVPVAAMAAVIVARLLDEENLLASQLPGYGAYRRRVTHRLVPRVW